MNRIRIPDTIKHLIILNVIFYIGMMMTPALYDMLAIWFPKNDNFKVWQIFSHMFMHSPKFLPHILFNMLALWMFGSPLEQMWGKKKFLFFYFSSGLGAVFLPWAIDFYQFNSILETLNSSGYTADYVIDILNQEKYNIDWKNILSEDTFNKFNSIFYANGVGASGAIMGLIAAFGLSFPNAKMALIFLPVPIAAKYFIPVLLAYETLSGIFGGTSILGVNVAHFAHVGGALTGGLIALYWKKTQFKHYN
ncbi:MAG: rhomboid family intramembrane serine protease [Flavobacteriaceae bacterium]